MLPVAVIRAKVYNLVQVLKVNYAVMEQGGQVCLWLVFQWECQDQGLSATQIIRNFAEDTSLLTVEDFDRYSLVTQGVMYSGTGGMDILFNWQVRLVASWWAS